MSLSGRYIHDVITNYVTGCVMWTIHRDHCKLSLTHRSPTPVVTTFFGQRTFCCSYVAYIVSYCVMAVSKSNLGLCSSLNCISLVISTVTLLLLLTGFVRFEFKLNYQDAKLAAVERLCMARTQDVSLEDDIADIQGKTEEWSVFWLRSLLWNSL